MRCDAGPTTVHSFAFMPSVLTGHDDHLVPDLAVGWSAAGPRVRSPRASGPWAWTPRHDHPCAW